MKFKTALRNLTRNLRRTALILMTVALGTGSLFLFHGFNAGVMNQYKENTIRARYGHGQINTKDYLAKAHEKPWEHWISETAAIEETAKAHQADTLVFPRISFFALLTNGNTTVAGRGTGVQGERESNFFTTMNVETGSMLSDQPNGILLGKGLAAALDVQPGDRVTVLANTVNGSLNGIDTEVVGIFHTGQKEYDDTAFRVQLDQAQLLLDTQKVESVAVGLADETTWPALAESIMKQFPDLEATSFAVLDKVYYQHSVDWLNSQFAFIQMIILTIVLLGIFNTVSVAVLERKQEIGNLRANGESRLDVLKLLCVEGLSLGVIGALLGIVATLFVNNTLLANGILMPPAPGITRQFHVMIELQPMMALTTFIMGALTAMVGTLFAAWRTTKISIAEALRST